MGDKNEGVESVDDVGNKESDETEVTCRCRSPRLVDLDKASARE